MKKINNLVVFMVALLVFAIIATSQVATVEAKPIESKIGIVINGEIKELEKNMGDRKSVV